MIVAVVVKKREGRHTERGREEFDGDTEARGRDRDRQTDTDRQTETEADRDRYRYIDNAGVVFYIRFVKHETSAR